MLSDLKRVKYACYTTNLSMSIVGNLSPILFLTFHDLYGISYSLLGLLIVINFSTQLGVDLVFSFFSYRFSMEKAVKIAPRVTVAGLAVYSLIPWLLPRFTYPGLVLGTMIFAVSGGLAEVLISPVIAALPAKDPDREMSRLHSVYAWGVVFVIVFSTLFLRIFGREAWPWLALLFSLIPAASAILFSRAKLPEMAAPEKISDVVSLLKNKYLWLSILAIALGGACECTMAQWSSGYLEQAFGISKVSGDIFGVALFAVMLGMGRSLYAKYGTRIERVLLLCALGAAGCYAVAAFTSAPLAAVAACAVTGLCVSMLWPGNLIVVAKRLPAGGVFVYAMMAAGGDLGGSAAPQMVGLITDGVIASPSMGHLAETLSLTPDQLGLKAGMVAALAFPIAAVIVNSVLLKTAKRFEPA